MTEDEMKTFYSVCILQRSQLKKVKGYLMALDEQHWHEEGETKNAIGKINEAMASLGALMGKYGPKNKGWDK